MWWRQMEDVSSDGKRWSYMEKVISNYQRRLSTVMEVQVQWFMQLTHHSMRIERSRWRLSSKWRQNDCRRHTSRTACSTISTFTVTMILWQQTGSVFNSSSKTGRHSTPKWNPINYLPANLTASSNYDKGYHWNDASFSLRQTANHSYQFFKILKPSPYQ